MYQKLKNEIKEIIEIVGQCPEALQEKCFELLLDNFLSSNNNSGKEGSDLKTSITLESNDLSEKQVKHDTNDSEKTYNEISLKDFHVKIQRFLNSNSISIEKINYLYYKEDGQIKPLYDSLNSTSMAECQIRLALLSAFENAFSDSNGEMTFNCENIREKCVTMKCYNGKNFTSYFKNYDDLWDNFPEKYDKSVNIALSTEGKKELAKVLLDLAKDE